MQMPARTTAAAHDVGEELGRQLEQLLGVARLADDLEAVVLEHPGDSMTDHHSIVCQQDPGRRGVRRGPNHDVGFQRVGEPTQRQRFHRLKGVFAASTDDLPHGAR